MRSLSCVDLAREHIQPDGGVELYNQITGGERSCGSNMYILHSANGILPPPTHTRFSLKIFKYIELKE